MFALLIPATQDAREAQFTLTADDAARLLNEEPPTVQVEHHYGRCIFELHASATGRTSYLLGPAMLSKRDTLQFLRDAGYQH